MGKVIHILRHRRRARNVLLVLAVLTVPALTSRDTALAARSQTVVPPVAGIPTEQVLSATANPNATPLLFSQDPTDSAQVYAKSQAYAAQNVTTCGGVIGATAGGCCPTSPSDGACDDHDPSVTGCADASSITVTQENIVDNSGTVIGLVETRYSATCKTNWTRLTGFGAYAMAVKQSTICRGTKGTDSDIGCSDTDTGTESTRFSDQLYAPTECATAFGTLVITGPTGTSVEFSAQTPPAC